MLGWGSFWVGSHLSIQLLVVNLEPNLRCLGAVFDGGADKKMDDASTKPIMFYLTKKKHQKGCTASMFWVNPHQFDHFDVAFMFCFFFRPRSSSCFLGKHPQDFEDGYVESEIQGHEGSVMKLSWIKRHETFKNMMKHGICRFIC